jgi:hypothetical protein
MAKFDISVLIPAIRTSRWVHVLETLGQSCKRYSFEVVFAGPFAPPPELEGKVKYIKTYRCPSSAGQMAAQYCEGRVMFHTVDDSRFVPDAIDLAMDLYESKNNRKDVICMRYTEEVNHSGIEFPIEFWNVNQHPSLRLPGIPQHFKAGSHFLIDLSYFIELGGFDCGYEYMNFNLHDLMFRVQADGGTIYTSPTNVSNADYFHGKSGDHAPIDAAHDIDYQRFRNKYNNPNALANVKIPYDNWQQQPEMWARRFDREYDSYDEMVRLKYS